MPTAADRVVDEALELPAEARIGLVERILASLNLPTRPAEYPDAWSEMSKNTRRCFVSRFPCGVIYQVKSGMLRIIAVANLHRRPGCWKDRV